jgi:outer membrane receptor for ferric coprogen and ferric-rhodotorulic acid
VIGRRGGGGGGAGASVSENSQRFHSTGRVFPKPKHRHLPLHAFPLHELAGTVKWLDGMYLDTALGMIRQPSYAVLSAYARYALSERLELAVNVNNLTDEKYLTSLYWDQAFHAAPRSGAVSVRLRY